MIQPVLTPQPVRLQKYLARCGVDSRRNCEALIAGGHVTVNDTTVTKMGTKITPGEDTIKVDGKLISPIKKDVTIILNKPAGYVSTMKDPQGRPCVADLVPVDKYPNLFPCGRLDRLTTGLLLFTTDGDLGQKLLHPKHETKKTYRAVVIGKIARDSKAADTLKNGVDIGDFVTSPADLKITRHFDFAEYNNAENKFFTNAAKGCTNAELPTTSKLIDKTFTEVEISIHEGKNRQVRRMFEAVGHHVLLLTRTKIGAIKLSENKLSPGE